MNCYGFDEEEDDRELKIGKGSGSGTNGGNSNADTVTVTAKKKEEEPEGENFTLLYKFWFMYGILWFTFSAAVEMLNICNGRDLGARKVVICCGGCMSVFWYLFGCYLRWISIGGRVIAGDYLDVLTEEEYEEDKDMYLVKSGRFLYNYCLAMPFVVIIIVFFALLINYIINERKAK